MSQTSTVTEMPKTKRVLRKKEQAEAPVVAAVEPPAPTPVPAAEALPVSRGYDDRVDQLFGVRNELRVLQRREKELAAAIQSAMKDGGLAEWPGALAVARIETGSFRKVDSARFLAAVGIADAAAAVSVTVAAAEKLLPADKLADVVQSVEQSWLRVVAK